jgi:hypothetical protein
MMKIEFPRLATHLTVLALSTLTVSNAKFGHAAQPIDAIQVDAYFIPRVLTSMSSLVPSPYADPDSLNNPLGVEQTASPRNEAMRSVVSQSPSQPATASLAASTKEPASKITLPQARDFTLTAQMTTSIERPTNQIAPPNNSFAMIGR